MLYDNFNIANLSLGRGSSLARVYARVRASCVDNRCARFRAGALLASRTSVRR